MSLERIVKNRAELQQALDDKVKKIIVHGDLAEKLHTGMKLKNASKWAIALLAISLAASPFTGGLSSAAAVPIAAFTGLEIALIIAVAALGIALIIVLCRDYKKVIFRAKHGDNEAELELEREEANP